MNIRIIIALFLILGINHSVEALTYSFSTFEADKPQIIQTIKTLFPDTDSITYTSVPRGIILSVAQFEIFDKNSYEISPNGKQILAEIVKLLKGFNNKFTIEVHGNILNKPEVYDWEESIIKANKVSAYIIKNFNIDKERIFSIGFGEFMPFNDNVSSENFHDNRIDFVIFDYDVSR